MNVSDNPQVFISYAHDDLPAVYKFYTGLKSRGVNVWLDKKDLGPGQWKTQIHKAIPQSRYFLFCISEAALRKTTDGTGFIDDELQRAFEIAMAQDERKFSIIPVRLEEVDRGDHRLSIFQQYDLFNDWEGELDRLAVYLGGEPFTPIAKRKDLSEDELLVDNLAGKAGMALYANEYDELLHLLDAINSLRPKDSSIWTFKSIVLERMGKDEKAKRALKKAHELDFDNTQLKSDRFYRKKEDSILLGSKMIRVCIEEAGFIAKWVIANGLGFLVSILFIYSVDGTIISLPIIPFGLVAFCQWSILRKRSVYSYRHVSANALIILPFIILVLLDYPRFFTLGIWGFGVGVLQILILRNYLWKSGWILITSVTICMLSAPAARSIDLPLLFFIFGSLYGLFSSFVVITLLKFETQDRKLIAYADG